jgi:membrane fusion protein (multidrug efflux system)
MRDSIFVFEPGHHTKHRAASALSIHNNWPGPVFQHEDANTMHATTRPSLTALRLAGATLAVLAGLAACGKKDAPAPGAAGPKPPPEVGVLAVHAQPVALQTELPGRVEAVRTAQVRARVNGVVQKRLFTEGSEVKAGQLLFRIDPATYQASVASAEAQLGRAQANLAQTSAQAARYKPLAEAEAVSKQEYTNVLAAQKQAEADVNAAKAALQAARINLGYTQVTAPISGRIGRALVTEGALVSATEATQLALIQQTSSVYVNTTQSANELQRMRKAGGGKLASGGIPVTVVLDDGTELARKGRLLFSDVSVDPTSGQVLLRTEVPNPDHQLLPGQYVRVRLAQAELPSGFLIPQQAVTRGTQGDTVIVVGADNKTSQRQVRVGPQQGTHWVVLDGLREGEQVVVDGFQKIMAPNQAVKPVPWTALPAKGGAPVAGATPGAPASAATPAPAAAGATSGAPANAGAAAPATQGGAAATAPAAAGGSR